MYLNQSPGAAAKSWLGIASKPARSPLHQRRDGACDRDLVTGLDPATGFGAGITRNFPALIHSGED